MEEVWKEINGFENRFKISNQGRIISINGKYKGERILSLSIDELGYYQAQLRNKTIKKKNRVHRLVAEAFIPNPKNLKTVNHKNGIKTDNRVENLEWLSQEDNNRHAHEIGLCPHGENHPNVKLTSELVLKMREIKNYTNLNCRKIADIFNINHSTAKDAIRGATWTRI